MTVDYLLVCEDCWWDGAATIVGVRHAVAADTRLVVPPLVVAMHAQGSEGTHKRPAQQLWTFDLLSGKRLSTVPGRSTISLTFSRNGQRLHGLDGEHGSMTIWQWSDSGPKRVQTSVAKAGESAMHLESHD